MVRIYARALCLVLCLVASVVANAQNKAYAQKIIKILTSPEFDGRGYVDDGHLKAAIFIRREFNRAGLRSFDGLTFFQPFNLAANTFPGNANLSVEGRNLLAGRDFIADPRSKACKGTFRVVPFLPYVYNDSAQFDRFFMQDHSQEFVLVDPSSESDETKRKIVKGMAESNSFKARGVIELTAETPIFSPSTWQAAYSFFKIKKEHWPGKADSVTVDLDAKFIPEVATQNVLGYIPGQVDSFVVFTAHYDHIGRLGKQVYYPGAHDNASGVAMVADLAQFLASQRKKPHYTYVFVAFGGEESGLVGSSFFTENPLFPLKQIKVLINFDMLGNGDEGITVVNGTEFPDEYRKLEEINLQKKYLTDIKPRGKAANSDHYPFYAKGVKSLYIYTRGSYKEYHVPTDRAEGLPLVAYEGIFRLVTDYIQQIR